MAADDDATAQARWNRPTLETGEPARTPITVDDSSPYVRADPGEPRTRSAFDPPRARYVDRKELARGGMGCVYAATDTALDRPVALKQALTDRGEDHLRLEREARITASLEHPSIVPVHDAGRDTDGRPYYVMRRISGQPLADRVAAAPDLRARMALVPNVLAAVDAAAFAHARNIVHRDIKPWNILLGDFGETSLIDWGLGRAIDGDADRPGDARPELATATVLGKVRGTPGYMAPEQARGEPVDARADVYALGATLFHVLANSSPYGDETPPTQQIALAAAARPIAFERIPAEVPGELVAIVAKAMAADVADRYQSAVELAADLRRFLSGQLVVAHRYSAGEILVRWLRRHRLAVGVALAALVGIAIVGAIAVVNIVRERDRADEASALAGERAEVALLDRASALAERDPAHAVALLATLPAGSRHLERARDIAAHAAARGIARGIVGHTGPIKVLALGPGGQLASTSEDGTLRIHDLARGTSRIAATPGVVTALAWVGDLIAFAAPGLHILDPRSGVTRALDEAASVDALWAAGPARVRYVDARTRRLLECDAGGGAPRVVASHVVKAAGEGERAILYAPGAGGVRLVQGDVVTELVEGGRVVRSLAIGPSGVAIAMGDEALAWSTTGVQLGAWKVPYLMKLFAGPTTLYAVAPAGAGVATYRLLPSNPPHEVLRTDGMPNQAALAGHGVAVVSSDGTLALIDGAGAHVIPHHKYGTRAVAGRPGERRVAVGSADGAILWWDLASVPEPQQVDVRGVAGVDAQLLYSVDSQLYATRRGGGPSQQIGSDLPVSASTAVTSAGSLTVFRQLGAEASVVDARAGTIHDVTGGMVVSDLAGGTVVVVRGERVLELAGTTERLAWTAPERVVMASVAGRRASLGLAGGDHVRVDLDTGAAERSTPPRAMDRIVIDRGGAPWFAHRNELWREVGGRFLPIAILPAVVKDLWAAGDAVAALLVDHAVWFASPGHVVNRLPPGGERKVSYGVRSLLVLDGLRALQLLRLDTGERSTWSVPLSANAMALGERDRTVAIEHGIGRAALVEVHVDPVPDARDEAALRAWLAGVTNAAVDASGALLWR